MGECGCGMDRVVGAIRCTGGWYVLGVYGNCEECHRISGVEIEFFSDDTFEGLGIEFFSDDTFEGLGLDRKLPDLTEKACGVGGLFLSVLAWDKLEAAFREDWVGEPMTEYKHPADFIHDYKYLIGIASHMTDPLEQE